MDVATPTNDCLSLVYDLLLPVIMKGNTKTTLSHQEVKEITKVTCYDIRFDKIIISYLFLNLQNRILGEIEEQIEEIFAVVFENYKSLDELSPSGMMDVFKPATGVAAPVLEPSVKLYKLLHDILSPEAQNKLYSYFQVSFFIFSLSVIMDDISFVYMV